MDQRIRLTTAAAVMIGGLLVALFFRRPMTEKDLPIPVHSEPLVLRKLPEPATTVAAVDPLTRTSPPSLPTAPPAEPRREAPTVLAPVERQALPPDFSKSYPAPAVGGNSRWGASLGEMLPEARPAAPARHKIVDGDSLASLAERYLGSPDRALEIYEANRGVLSHPRILPIGAELKIPQ